MRIVGFAFSVLVLCAGCGHTEYFLLEAPPSFRADGEPWQIGEWDPWSIVRAEGCIGPGEAVEIRARRAGRTLAVSVPGARAVVPPDYKLASPDAPVTVTGSGTAADPYRVRFATLGRWRSFLHAMTLLEAADALPMDGSVDRRWLELSTQSELDALLAERPDVAAAYRDHLEGQAEFAGLSDACRQTSRSGSG